MVQIYGAGNTTYTRNGDAVIQPLSCVISAAINGAWELTLTAPIDSRGVWKTIETGAVIKAPSFNGEQLFRIIKTDKNDAGITATAEPIFLDAGGDCFLMDVRPTNKTGQAALDDILAPNRKYSASSNIQTRATAYYIRKNALEAIAGNDEQSFLSRWGGEILYNNFEIIINDRIGGDYGAQLLYGRNIPVNGLRETIDTTSVVTRIIPKAYNGYTLPGAAPWVDSPLINTYPTITTKVIDFEHIKLYSDIQGEEAEDDVVCQNMNDLYIALRQAAREEYEKGLDKPKVSISADMVLLENTEQYKEYKDLEKVSLGDTIHIKHDKLGIVSDARIVGLTYDAVRQAVETVSIGDFVPSFVSRVASVLRASEKALTKAGAVRGEQIEGLIDGIKTQLRIQNTVAQRQEARAILFEDLDPDSPTFGASAYGSQGWQISNERTADGRDWVWTTAATADGIIADAIVTGTLDAIDITGVNITGSTIEGNTINGGTITGAEISGGKFQTTGIISEGGALTDTVTIWKGYVFASREDGATIYNGLMNSDLIQSYIVQNDEITAGASLQGDGALYAHSGTTSALIDAANNIIQLKSGAADYIELNGATHTGRIQNGNNYISLNTATPVLYVGDGTRTLAMDGSTGAIRTTDGTNTARVYPDHIEIYNGTSLEWATEYKRGSIVSNGFGIYAGHVTNSTRSIDFFIPLNISAAGRTAYLSIPTNCSVRTPNGYIDGSQYLSSTGITITSTCTKGGIYVRFTKSTAFTNVSNNQPVAVAGTFSITFTA